MATLLRRATLVLPVTAVLVLLAMGIGLTPGSNSPPQAEAATTLDLSMVKPGDIILGHSPQAKLWRKYLGGKWNYWTHAAIVLDKYSVMEAREPGTTVSVYPIEDWRKDFQSYYTRVAILRVNTSDYHRQAAVNKAKEQYGKGFLISPAAKHPNTRYHYCSSLVWHAYRWGVAIDLDSDGGPYVNPDDIALDSDIQYISVQGR